MGIDASVLAVIGVVVLAVVALMLAGRGDGEEPSASVVAVGDDGLVVTRPGEDGADEATVVVPWASLYEVTVISRRAWRRTWFGFEVRTEEAGLVTIDGGRGLGEAFLAESHRLPGFDHDGLADALRTRRARAECFRR